MEMHVTILKPHYLFRATRGVPGAVFCCLAPVLTSGAPFPRSSAESPARVSGSQASTRLGAELCQLGSHVAVRSPALFLWERHALFLVLLLLNTYCLKVCALFFELSPLCSLNSHSSVTLKSPWRKLRSGPVSSSVAWERHCRLLGSGSHTATLEYKPFTFQQSKPENYCGLTVPIILFFFTFLLTFFYYTKMKTKNLSFEAYNVCHSIGSWNVLTKLKWKTRDREKITLSA